MTTLAATLVPPPPPPPSAAPRSAPVPPPPADTGVRPPEAFGVPVGVTASALNISEACTCRPPDLKGDGARTDADARLSALDIGGRALTSPAAEAEVAVLPLGGILRSAPPAVEGNAAFTMLPGSEDAAGVDDIVDAVVVVVDAGAADGAADGGGRAATLLLPPPA